MNPFEYVEQYHSFAVSDPRLGLRVTTQIAGYNNLYSVAGSKELSALLWNLSQKYFGKKQVPQVFSVRNEPRIDANQHFSIGSLNRVFQSRGSPYEFTHALRLAFLAGRCGAKGTLSPEQYAKKWFTNDCVSFAANYTGVSPSTPVFAYAEGIAERYLGAKGVAPDVRLSADIVHIPPRRRREDIAEGDLLLTLSTADHRGICWRHIAVVQKAEPVGTNQVKLSIAEWGGGMANQHTVRDAIVTLHDGSKAHASLKNVVAAARKKFRGGPDFVAYDGHAPGPKHEPALRIFFDASSFASIESRGWMVAGKPAPF